MTQKKQVYRCEICGNVVEVLHPGAGQLVCCGQAMTLMTEKATDAGNEKHLPVVEKTEKGVKVKVGEVPHPMEDAHYIEWVEIVEECGNTHRRYLNPGEAPEAEFMVDCKVVEARSYCNKHGLWKAEVRV